MKTKVTAVLMFIIATMMMVASVFAQMVPQPPYDPFVMTAPIVPTEVIISGRQSVTDYLSGQIDAVDIKYTGRSWKYKTDISFETNLRLSDIFTTAPSRS